MLDTKRLQIREINEHDILHVHALLSLPETDEYNTLGIPENIEATMKIFNEWLIAQKDSPRNSHVFSIEMRELHQFVGLIGLNMGKPKYRTAEVWFKLHKDFWGIGLGTEALKRVLQFAFEDLMLHRIEAGCAVENFASSRVLEKVGMTREGMKRKKLPLKSGWQDNYFYGILDEDMQS